MHETSVAMRIIAAVEEIAKREGASRILEVEIHVGELRALDIETLQFALEALSEGTVLEGAKFKIVEVEALARCRKCGCEWRPRGLSLSALHFNPEAIVESLKCPRCGARDFEILKGEELLIKRITFD